MSSSRYCACIVALIASATASIFCQRHSLRSFLKTRPTARYQAAQISARSARHSAVAPPFSIPLTFEPTGNDSSGSVQYVGRGKGLSVALAEKGIELLVPQGPTRRPAIASLEFAQGGLAWHGAEKVRGETNYFVGNNPRKWRTHVPHFARAEAHMDAIEVIAYGNESGLEYDLRLPPDADASKLRLLLSGATDVRLDENGDVAMRVGVSNLLMRKPAIFETERFQDETRTSQSKVGENTEKEPNERRIDGSYILHSDGAIGFRVVRHDPRAAVVIDPSITLAYSSFLGGAGTETASGLAVDSNGKIYVGGTTTSPTTFPETTTAQLGPGTAGASGNPPEFFVAKIDPTQSGANSLIYLTFLGGSLAQSGGLIAVDGSDDVAITGTTTSTDFPVTDQSKPTSGLTNGGNDTTVSEIDPTGSRLLYSTLFGGNGSQSTEGAGGIALDPAGNLFISSDANSTNLPVTTNAYTQTYNSPTTDGFLAEFQLGATPSLVYCTYLGLDGQVGIGGLAIDASENAYIAGFTSDPNADFPSTNAVQSAYGGGAFDAFLMKISTYATASGTTTLGYATLLGGSGSDQAFAVALDDQNPPSAYVTGTTSSKNFPTNGTVAAYQPNLPSNASAQTSDAFLAVVAQSISTGTTSTSITTSLAYSTYLGGSQTDSGESVTIAAPDEVYIAGTANSWDFPWHDNLQPFNGYGDAFVAKLDPTSAGAASLIYATPLGGTSPPGVNAGAQGTAVVMGASGSVWIAGQTTSADFPAAGNAGNGFQQICSSCQESPPATDAFIASIQENDSQQLPSLIFSAPRIVFGNQAIGSANIPPGFAAITNSGEAPLQVSVIRIAGPNSSDFSLSNESSCSNQLLPSSSCSFEVNFVPTTVGLDNAFVQVSSNAPGDPQVLEIVGGGVGLQPLPANVNFGGQVLNTVSTQQSVALTNTSNATIFIDNGPTIAGVNATQFRFPLGNPCLAQASGLPSLSACQILIEFAPTSAGSFQAQVNVQYHVQGLSEQNVVIPLSGIGLAAAPVASLQPPSVNFGTVPVGTTAQAQVATLTNTGSAALNVTAISITGTNASDFGIVTAGSSPCPASSGSLPIDGSCTVGVQFAPKTAGSKSAALTFTDNAAGSPQSVSLSGTAQLLAIGIAPTSLTFGSQSVGTTSTAQQITLTNSGTAALTINGVSVTGTNAADFTANWPCLTLVPNATCLVSVKFTPQATGARSATVSISDDAANSPQTVSVTGTGTQATVVLAPTGPINFGNQAAGTASAATPVTVTNSGTGALAVSKIVFSGTNAADFTETDNCNTSVAPAGACTIKITFQPQCGNSHAARSATLVLTDNAPNSPQDVALSGTATGDMCFAAASGGSTSATVSSGSSTSYSLEVSAASSYTGSVALACSNAPQDATCTVNPASVSVAGSTLVPFTVNVTTNGAAAMIRHLPPGEQRGRAPFSAIQVGFCVFTCCGMLLVLVGARSNRRLRLVSVAMLLCVAGIAAAGCGAGYQATPSDPDTPTGTYKLTLTGTASDGTSQSIQLTLTVD